MQNLEDITHEISKRLHYAEGSEQQTAYYEAISKVGDEDDYQSPSYYERRQKEFTKLENQKIMNIKNNLAREDNLFFSKIIRENLPFILVMVDEKTTELEELLHQQKNSSFYQKVYEKISGPTNQRIEINNSISKLKKEIHDLTSVINDIDTLLPFY